MDPYYSADEVSDTLFGSIDWYDLFGNNLVQLKS